MTHPSFERLPRAMARALVVGAAAAILALNAQWPTSPAQAAGEGIVLAPHRAVYEMSLAESRGGAGVTQVTGRMVYELTGSACEGYTQNMRFVTRMTSGEGSAQLNDLRSSSFEDSTGKSFRFNSNSYKNEQLTDTTQGDAARETGEVKVELTFEPPWSPDRMSEEGRLELGMFY